MGGLRIGVGGGGYDEVAVEAGGLGGGFELDWVGRVDEEPGLGVEG